MIWRKCIGLGRLAGYSAILEDCFRVSHCIHHSSFHFAHIYRSRMHSSLWTFKHAPLGVSLMASIIHHRGSDYYPCRFPPSGVRDTPLDISALLSDTELIGWCRI
jgi:hypothetical protein